MKTLLEIFVEAKDMENMGQGKLLICMQSEPFAIFNAKILDPYLGSLTTELNGKEVAISFAPVQAMNVQADFVD